ncbi:transposase [Jatrophihabitans lederbergiae]|uniref:transposase n=1 Tax=Jatrophihabitans lederbergiae TaxID=3075547 RepID=UPI0037BEBCB0
MAYPSDLTDEQWAVLEPVFNSPGKRGRKHGDDLRTVVDAMLYIAQTGCQWRYLPESFGRWTRVWSQFRRWSRNGTWARALTVLHAAAREVEGRAQELVLVDRGVTAQAANKLGRPHGVEVRRVGWDQQAAGLPSHPARLARQGGPRTSRPQPQTRQVVREHRISDRLAPGRLRRHNAPAPEPPRPTAGQDASSRIAVRSRVSRRARNAAYRVGPLRGKSRSDWARHICFDHTTRYLKSGSCLHLAPGSVAVVMARASL